MPGFGKGFRRRVGHFAKLPREMHAGDMATVFGDDLKQFSVQLHDVGFLGAAVALLMLHLDFGEHLGRHKFTDVVHVATVIGRLQADKAELGLAQETFDVEISGNIRCSNGCSSNGRGRTANS